MAEGNLSRNGSFCQSDYEADLMSARRAAVTETMYRLGKPLGTRGRTPEQIREMNRLANIARAAQHERFVQATMPVIHDLRRQGITGYKAIAKALTAQGIPTASGRGRWYIDTVKKLIKAHEPDYQPRRAPLRREHLLKMIVARRATVQRLANERALRWAQVLEELALQGIEADREVALAGVGRRVPRPRGGAWTAEAVRRLKERLRRLAADDPLSSDSRAVRRENSTQWIDERDPRRVRLLGCRRLS